MDNNPELIQPEDWMHPTAGGIAVPIFLIHDGGGTTFAYHCLDPLGRSVYGIHNPHFRTQEVFEGGIPEMGRLYSSFIKKAIADPDFPARRNQHGGMDILLGGWSMGGLLSLEVARQLAEDCSVRILGILMMDSVCPIKNPDGPLAAAADMSEEGKTKNQILTMRAMTAAREMLKTWDLPVWDGHLVGQRPKLSMLRATDRVPMDGDGVSSVDVHRDERNLGWDRYADDMFTDVVDVEGHHFNMFSFDRVPGVTEAMKKCLDKLEKLA